MEGRWFGTRWRGEIGTSLFVIIDFEYHGMRGFICIHEIDRLPAQRDRLGRAILRPPQPVRKGHDQATWGTRSRRLARMRRPDVS
jgi:hypothetical protein